MQCGRSSVEQACSSRSRAPNSDDAQARRGRQTVDFEPHLSCTRMARSATIKLQTPLVHKQGEDNRQWLEWVPTLTKMARDRSATSEGRSVASRAAPTTNMNTMHTLENHATVSGVRLLLERAGLEEVICGAWIAWIHAVHASMCMQVAKKTSCSPAHRCVQGISGQLGS